MAETLKPPGVIFIRTNSHQAVMELTGVLARRTNLPLDQQTIVDFCKDARHHAQRLRTFLERSGNPDLDRAKQTGKLDSKWGELTLITDPKIKHPVDAFEFKVVPLDENDSHRFDTGVNLI